MDARHLTHHSHALILSLPTRTEGSSKRTEESSTPAEGWPTRTEGWFTRTHGWFTRTEGWLTRTEGWLTSAEGWFTPAEGWFTSAEGSSTSAEGWLTRAARKEVATRNRTSPFSAHGPKQKTGASTPETITFVQEQSSRPQPLPGEQTSQTVTTAKSRTRAPPLSLSYQTTSEPPAQPNASRITHYESRMTKHDV